MSQSLRAAHPLDGVTPTGTPVSGLLRHDASPQEPRRALRRAKSLAATDGDETRLQIEEPLRFHRARYERLTCCLHGKCNLAAALLTGLVLVMLGWRAESGETISPERWLCGFLSGWFIVGMARLALFTCLAAPRSICYADGRLRISGLGILRAGQVLDWSIQRGVPISSHGKPGARLQICCRWCGCERHWMILMEEGPQVERLQKVLETHLPRSPRAASAPLLNRTIEIEAGILTQ